MDKKVLKSICLIKVQRGGYTYITPPCPVPLRMRWKRPLTLTLTNKVK